MIKTFFLRLCLGLALGSTFLLSSAQAARVALVIGNAAYLEGPLRNPVNDARAMDQKLTSLGFRVERIENLKRQQIGRTMSAFSNSIKAGDEVVVFYAGHGVQVKGINYLPAVDADIQTEDDVPLNSLNLNALMERLDETKAGLKLFFLDACRNNPYARTFRSGDRGLARVSAAPSGTLIHFATRPGSVAADGTGANGLYTTELLRHLGTPNVPVETMLKRVSVAVETQSKGQQEPWTEGGIRGEFYFKSGAGIQVASLKPELIVPTVSPGQSSGLTLDDLQKEEASRNQWAQWQVRMKADFDKTAAFSGSSDLQVKAWDRFLTAWGQDNPLSLEDDDLRVKAQTKRDLLQRNGATQNQATVTELDGFVLLMDGVAKDLKTELQWMRCSLGQRWDGMNCRGDAKLYKFYEAPQAASALNVAGGYAGKTDWRIPSVRELFSLVKCSEGAKQVVRDPRPGWEEVHEYCLGTTFLKPTIAQQVFPSTPSATFWSSTPMTSNNYAWAVNFDGTNWSFFSGGGYVSAPHRDVGMPVRLVRGAAE
jgi:hypothetical protein